MPLFISSLGLTRANFGSRIRREIFMAASTSPARVQVPQISESLQMESLPLEERIRQRAHEIWLQNGGPPGTELIDWLEAETEILEEQR
jgi:hypothetical protein